ncbi:PAS domain S-box protein [Natrinema sp. 1APR25-10V2]|uniref:PAS domain S-box protein n=1 Tax=Natrinema sp. 1APR25-10V2 TaxID=2951081 RepID=UPI00287513A8|nr:PAS domain S-box protein [Natrinema sp. 1APR25-10V2]MDS0473612.1 PAS domain S-box protein [Natrinema sp. 1APR25-10V2]
MDATSYREALYDVFVDTDRDVEAQIARALEIGTEYFDLPVGFLTRIEDETQTIVQAVGSHELIQPGESCPLEEAYCRRTVETNVPLAVQQASVSSAISETAIETFDLGAYIGGKVVVDGDTYGTVCFADKDERDTPFSEVEKTTLELLTKLIGQALEQRAHERELRRRNERLEREKQRFEGIAETSFDILFRVGLETEFTYVSSAVERVLGYEPETLIGRPITEFIAESATEAAITGYSQVIDGTPVENLELEFVDADGELVVLEVNGTPLVDDGTVRGVQGVGRDVTARKEREQELRIKNRAMDEARIGISISDAEQSDEPLVYVNEGFERLTGYEAADSLGRNCRFLQGEATDPETVATLRERIDANEPVSVEILNYRADGTPFWNQVRVSPVENADGDVTHYLGFQTEITERKRTDQLVRLLNRVLRHNLRNDMNVLLGLADRLENAPADDAETPGEQLSDTAAALIELSEQARDLERYARRERDPQRLPPDSLLTDVANDYRERFPSATVDVTVHTDRPFCAGPELERAVAELVENALKHNPAPEPWVGLAVADDDSERVVLTVEDDGPGISEMETTVIANGQEEALEHGSGLGLWLVNWIVTRYGGSFQIEARDGETAGSVATVRLPGIGPDDSLESVAQRPTVLFR